MAVIVWKQFAQTFLRSMAQAKVPVTTAIREMDRLKITYRRTEMLATYRTYAKIPEVTDRYKYIPRKYRLPAEIFAKAHPYQSKKFLYEGVFRVRDTVTGKLFLKPSRVASDFWLTPEKIAEQSMRDAEEGFKGYHWEVEDFGITGSFTKEKELF